MNSQLMLTIPEVVRASGLSRSAVYIALKQGELTAKKAGRRTLIAVRDLEDYLAKLPNYKAGE